MSSVKTTCIRHPSHERFLRIFPWQIELCEGNHCAAYLISYFESWHNYKLQKQFENKRVNDIAENHGDKRTQDEHSLQFHSYEDFEYGLLGLYKKNSIRDALAQLVKKSIISIHSNPNPKYMFDKTQYFQFYPELIQVWIEEIYIPIQKNDGCLEDRLNVFHFSATTDFFDFLGTCQNDLEMTQTELTVAALLKALADRRSFSEDRSAFFGRSGFSESTADHPFLDDRTSKKERPSSEKERPSSEKERPSSKIERAISKKTFLENNKEKAAAVSIEKKRTPTSEQTLETSPNTILTLPQRSFVKNEKEGRAELSFPAFSIEDSVIQNPLTAWQKARLQQLAEEMTPRFLKLSVSELFEELAYEMSDHSFSKCGRDFNKKYHVLRKSILKGDWVSSQRHLNAQSQNESEKHEKERTLKERLATVKLEITSLLHSIARYQEKYPDVAEGFRKELAVYQEELLFWNSN